MKKHLVSFSGGLGSWAAAKRVVERHGVDGVTLLFADTNMEDEDLYRFLADAEANIGIAITRISDGRTPWDVMRDVRFIAKPGVDPCSRVLKRELLDKYRNQHFDPANTTCYIGIDWTEAHRLERLQKRIPGWTYEAPMCEPPYMSKRDMHAWAKREGITPPRLYDMGFPHNNCGGFCVKAGQAQFALLLRTMPGRYAWHEAQEEALRAEIGDHAIMRDRRGGKSRPMSMREFRERIEASDPGVDLFEWGGCGCAIE